MSPEAEILEPAHDIVEQITANPALAVLDMAKFNRFYDRLKDEVARVAGDISTSKGRDEIRSTAYKIAQAKSAIEKARLKLTEDWRRQTSEANERGKVIKTKLEELADEVRRPLTEWEEAEKARQAQHEAMVSWLLGAGAVKLDESAGDVEARLAKVSNHVFDPAIHGDQVPHLEKLRAQAVDALTQAVDRLAREEAERAELARLRAEAEARAAEEEAREAARLEAERLAEQERLEQERLARVAAEAAERARREAEAEARRAEEERERAHAQALAAEKARADAAEAAARAERERQEAEARAAAEAERKRQEDREHRGRIMGAAKQALIDMGIDEPKAREIVLAIAAGSVPHCKMVF